MQEKLLLMIVDFQEFHKTSILLFRLEAVLFKLLES